MTDADRVAVREDRPVEPAASPTSTPASPARVATDPPPAAPRTLLVLRLLDQPRVLLPALWAAGAALVLGWLATGLLRARALARRAVPVTDPDWLDLADRVRRQLGLRRVVSLRRVPDAVVPMTFGWRRPVVLLPADADAWSASRRRHVLLHELAHVRRRDWPGQVLAQVALALWWWQPLAWLAVRELRRSREEACDDQVLAAGSRASEYADHLLAIAASRGAGLAGAAALAMARRSQLEGRLLAVLEQGRPRVGPGRRHAVAGSVTAALLVAGLACVQPQGNEVPAQDGAAASRNATPVRVAQEPAPGDDSFAPQARMPGAAAPRARSADSPAPGSGTPAPFAPAPGAPAAAWRPRFAVAPAAPAPPRARVAPLAALAPLPPADAFAASFDWPDPAEFEWGFDPFCDEDRCRWSWSDGDTSWKVTSIGCVEPDEQGLQVGWLDEDASLTIERTSGGTTDRLVALAGEEDDPTWSGTVGGREVAGDEARAEAERLMPAVLDGTGLFASRRVAHLVETGGPAAALDALRALPPGMGRQDLLQCLLLEHELDAPEFAAALELAAQEDDADAMLAELLACVGPDALGDPELVEPLLRACEAIDSDAYQAEALGCLLGDGSAESPAVARALRAAAAGLESDAYAAEVLGWVPGPRLRDPAVREAFVDVLDGIESDAYVAEALAPRFDERAVKGELLAALLAAAARGVDSDAYMAEILASLPGRALSDAAARDALLAALGSIESDAYLAEVLQGWLPEASPATAAALLPVATASLDSDAYMAEVLVCLPEAVLGDAAARPAFDAALATIQSSSYRREVLESFGLLEEA
jgi:beta-lactamase regulating signal transducer with metallopeptidase domain